MTQQARRSRGRPYLVRIVLIGIIVISILLMISILLPFDWVIKAYLWYKDGIIDRDSDGNGVVDYVETWNDGRLISSRWDTDSDGRFDTFATYQDERIAIFEVDFNRDGNIDYKEYRDEKGNARYQIDRNYDGVFEVDQADPGGLGVNP